MSRADYLSKYLAPAKSKKKERKKSAEDKLQTQISIHEDALSHQESTVLEEDTNLHIENEEAPAYVDSPAVHQERSLFKRIDNGKEINKSPSSMENDRQSQNTVYRDSSGRIINIEAKSNDIRAARNKKLENETREREVLNASEVSGVRNSELEQKLAKATRFDFSVNDEEYKGYMKKRKLFEDPIATFSGQHTDISNVASVTGKPNYTKGVNPANRFKIPAGYYWDGINRSNGFEVQLEEKRNDNRVKKVLQSASTESYTEYDPE